MTELKIEAKNWFIAIASEITHDQSPKRYEMERYITQLILDDICKTCELIEE